VTPAIDQEGGLAQNSSGVRQLIAGYNQMESAHRYHTVAWWISGQTGLAKSDSAPNAIHFTAPPQFGGLEGRWTPEDLLLTALASCFTTTFHSISLYAKFKYIDLQVEADGTVSKMETGYGFSEIIIRPNLMIVDEENRELGLSLLRKAAGLCLVSRTLTPAPKFEISVEIRKHTLA
jgi:organic hydroperoxide reductase OsmC/OhrA